MRNIAGNRVFNMILLFTIIGEFIVPWILERFYSEYNGKIMVMSVLGSPQSPVRLVYNIWLIWLGGFLAYTAGVAGVGMCLSMKVIGNGSTAMFVLGVIVGIIGLLGMGVNYPIYKKLLAQGKQKYAFEIMELAKEISEK